MKSTAIECGLRHESLDSWTEFISFIQEAHANCPAFIYRGEADASWLLQSSLDRRERRFPQTKNFSGGVPSFVDCPPVPRETHLEAFKEAVRGKRGSNPRDLCEDEWWALAQHHGLSTPLLDWAYSPFVALFFAFENEGYIDWTNRAFKVPETRAVYVASSHGVVQNGTAEHPTPIVFSPRREITYRLSSQSGVLMKMPPGSDLESNVRGRFPDQTQSTNRHASAVLTKIVIPDAGRVDCLKFLNKMNINRMSLFADLDGAAQYINSLWELDFDTGLGFLPDGTTR